MIVRKAVTISRTLLSKNRFEHACRVAALLTEPTDEELAAAYLHDILEDTDISELDLKLEVGRKTTELIKELTEKGPRDFSHFISASKEAKRIKLCDRIDNIQKRVNALPEPFIVKYLVEYVKESEKLLGYLKGADEQLESKLEGLIGQLKSNCDKYLNEEIL